MENPQKQIVCFVLDLEALQWKIIIIMLFLAFNHSAHICTGGTPQLLNGKRTGLLSINTQLNFHP